VRDLVKGLGLPEEQEKVVFVSGTVRKEDHRLTDADEVAIFRPVGGG
jgi:sulfur carrier protein ThiS